MWRHYSGSPKHRYTCCSAGPRSGSHSPQRKRRAAVCWCLDETQPNWKRDVTALIDGISTSWASLTNWEMISKQIQFWKIFQYLLYNARWSFQIVCAVLLHNIPQLDGAITTTYEHNNNSSWKSVLNLYRKCTCSVLQVHFQNRKSIFQILMVVLKKALADPINVI